MKKDITGNSDSKTPSIGNVLEDIQFELNAANRAFQEKRYSDSLVLAFRAVKIARKRKRDMGFLRLSDLRNQLLKGEELSSVRNRIEHGKENNNDPQMTHKLFGGKFNCSDTGVVDLSGTNRVSGIKLLSAEECEGLKPQELYEKMMQKEPKKLMGEVDLDKLEIFIKESLTVLAKYRN